MATLVGFGVVWPQLNGGFINIMGIFGGLHDKDYRVLGLILGSPCFGKLRNLVVLKV